MNSIQAQVKTFLEITAKYNFTVTVSSDSVLRISKNFTPNDCETFTKCDMIAADVLNLAPLKGGSIWGTDGGSIGGAIAIKTGNFVMNKSGSGGVRFMRELSKQLKR